MTLKYLPEILDLIFEDITQTQVTQRKYGGNFNRTPQHSKSDLGSGHFSRVTRDRNDPHMIKKSSNRPIGTEKNDADGFMPFIEYLVQHDMMDNIHFPKVYKANRSTDRDGLHKDKFEIEKLIPLQSLSEMELDSIIETHFTDRARERDATGIAYYIEIAITSDARLDNYIKSDLLKEAIRFVRKAGAELEFGIDLHEENIMARRTPTGLQLVLSDPLGLPRKKFQ